MPIYVARQIVDAACQVHTALAPGPLESVYEVVLAYEIEPCGLPVAAAPNGRA